VTSPLSSPRLRRVLTAYTINRLGTWFGLLALLLAVFDHTHSAIAVAALLFAGQALPAFVVPALVARVEASSRGGELSGLYFFEAVVTALLAVLLWHFWLPAVLLLVALDGTAALAASALLRAEVARIAREDTAGTPAPSNAAEPSPQGGPDPAPSETLVTSEALAASEALVASEAGADEGRGGDGSPEDERGHEAERRANAALNVAFSTTFVLGPVLGGAMVAAVGAPATLFVDVGSFLVCGALLLDLHPHVEEAGGDSVRARLSAAWKHITETPSLPGLLIAEGFALVFFESAGPIEVTFAEATLHAGDRGFGLLLTSWGAGAVIGSLVFARSLRKPLGALLSGGTLAVGLAYIGFAASPSLLVACGAALVGGIGNGVELPSLISIVQRLTPPALHGRMMGAVESLGAVCVAIGFPLGGILVALSSPREAFLAVGLGAVASAGALLVLAPKGVGPGSDDGADAVGAKGPERASGAASQREPATT